MAARSGLPLLAVLPFRELRTPGPGTYLGEGLAEELLLVLKRVPGVRTVSRTTSFPLGVQGLSPVEAGRRLHADFVAGGTLELGEGSMSLRVEVVRTKTGAVVWEQTTRSGAERLQAAVEDVAAGIALALGLAEAAPRRRGPLNLKAYQYYLEGRQYYFRYSRHGMDFAAKLYRQALEEDPGYGPAWAGLANCAAFTYIYLDRDETHIREADACSLKALELDPGLPEALAARGVALSAAGRAEEAEAAFEQSLALDPDLFAGAYFYGRHCLASDKPEMAIQFFEYAALLRPEDFQAILLAAQVYHSLGLDDEAARCRRDGLEKVERRLAHTPDDVRARYLGANALVGLGEREKGLAWARQARAQDPDDPMLLYNLGCIHALAGDAEEALDCLGWAVAAGLNQKEWLLHDGDLDLVRGQPRFQELLASLA
jgi:tetratricopeptide (TPR) repeat protein